MHYSEDDEENDKVCEAVQLGNLYRCIKPAGDFGLDDLWIFIGDDDGKHLFYSVDDMLNHRWDSKVLFRFPRYFVEFHK